MQTAHHFDRFLHFDSIEFDLNRITKLVSFTCQSKQTPSILIGGKKNTEQNNDLKVVKSLLNSVAILNECNAFFWADLRRNKTWHFNAI